MLAHVIGWPHFTGGIGVDIFFVLSGFLITGILSGEFQRYGSISRKNFYIRRLLRLSPCLVACVLLFVILSLVSLGSVRMDIFIISLTYTSNFARALFGYDLQHMGHCWSLAIEEQYYLVWPLAIVALERHLETNLNKFLVLLSFALALALYRAAMVGTFGAERIYFGLDTHMDGLVLGSSLSYLVQFLSSIEDRKALDVFFKRVSRIALPISILITLGLMFLSWYSPWMGRLGFTLAAMAACVVVLDLVASPFSLFRNLLENRVLTYCGKISYGLYLYHYPIYYFVNDAFRPLEWVYRVPIKVLSTFAIASLSYHLLEKPILSLKKHFEHEKRN
ncbi:peptidoglycan/LPS O-acetylase OafA/YrhL [Roseimicrobium gellanilyticum]|uniref:Peptidoglycan/LPS O-acetylase OafA/YrhL n=2 Tax=Roseimicrobium gellanilyticum TaxID=748857 RepID=A0A366HLI0_9BACT|nr:peptidoglycan/LPS O-acetylase OafA/YrhL [Roseimicrobium gellanilyticum]